MRPRVDAHHDTLPPVSQCGIPVGGPHVPGRGYGSAAGHTLSAERLWVRVMVPFILGKLQTLSGRNKWKRRTRDLPCWGDVHQIIRQFPLILPTMLAEYIRSP